MPIKRTIIGIIISIGLIVQPSLVNAFYSPTIAKKASIIKSHIKTARQENGTGSLEDAFQQIIEQNKAAAERNQAQGLPGELSATQLQILRDLVTDKILRPLDDIFMIFNMIPSSRTFASKCLRNDIWALQDLRDAVIQEMLKSYMMYDRANGDLLKDDYKWLVAHINILKEYGNDPTKRMLITTTENDEVVTKYVTSNQYLFNSISGINYYSMPTLEEEVEGIDEETCVLICESQCAIAEQDLCEEKCASQCTEDARIKWTGCPQSEFLPVFNEVWESIQNVGVVARGSSVEWGSIWEMAEARARKRAAEWIKSNQITLTIGGEEGGNPQSLIKGKSLDGLARIRGQFKNELQTLKSMVGPLIPLFDWAKYVGGIIGTGISPNAEIEDAMINHGCMYFYQDVRGFKACTPEQLLDYYKCKDDEKDAEENHKINCNLYQDIKKPSTGLDELERQQLKALEYQTTIERTETAYIYNLKLNSVGENAIQALAQPLKEMDGHIQAGSEDAGDSEGLPTIYKNLKKFTNKYCGGE